MEIMPDDEQIFCVYRWRRSAGNRQTVHRKPKDFAKEVGTWERSKWASSFGYIRTKPSKAS